MATNVKEDILTSVNEFLNSFSDTKPPFTKTFDYIQQGSFAVLSHPSGVIQSTLSELVHSWEDDLSKVYASGAASASETIAEPGPEIWVSDKFAAVWTGFLFKINGDEKIRGVYALTLSKGLDGWRIIAVADKMWRASEASPHLTLGATPELMKPIIEVFRSLESGKLDEVASSLLPNSGATYSNHPASISLPSMAYLEKIKAIVNLAQDSMNWEGRVIGDVGFIWAPISADQAQGSSSCFVFTLLRKDDRWLISGIQSA